MVLAAQLEDNPGAEALAAGRHEEHSALQPRPSWKYDHRLCSLAEPID